MAAFAPPTQTPKAKAADRLRPAAAPRPLWLAPAAQLETSHRTLSESPVRRLDAGSRSPWLDDDAGLEASPPTLNAGPIQRMAEPAKPAGGLFGRIAKGVAGLLQPAPRPANRTGLPDRLKAGVEALSGLAMDDVRVHRNSPEPAKLGALAYAHGSDIHLGPSQEQHLPHEAWHVVQQKQGRVQARTQMKVMGINDDLALEAEADRLGSRAAGEVGSGPTTTHEVDDAALQPAQQMPGGSLDAKAKRARKRVAREAKKKKYNGNYRDAYLALRRDPALWALDKGGSGNARRTYVYLPSYNAEPWQLNLSVDFELYVNAGNYVFEAANYPAITIPDVVKVIDEDSAKSILKATNSPNAAVSIKAVLSMDIFEKAESTTPKTRIPIRPITIAKVKDTRSNLIPSDTTEIGSNGFESGTIMFRLAGKVTAIGTETVGQVTVQVDALMSKEAAVKANFP